MGAPPTIDELAGLTFNGLNYAADMAMFSFGPLSLRVAEYGPRKGETTMVGSHALHVQCSWRLIGPAKTLLANNDTPAKALNHLIGMIVSKATFDRAAGAVRVLMGSSYRIDVTPDGGDYEQWRLLNRDLDAEHLVWGLDDGPTPRPL